MHIHTHQETLFDVFYIYPTIIKGNMNRKIQNIFSIIIVNTYIITHWIRCK